MFEFICGQDSSRLQGLRRNFEMDKETKAFLPLPSMTSDTLGRSLME